MTISMMVLMAHLRPEQLELVHRYFDGELSGDEQADVDVLLRDEPEARRALKHLRGLDRTARNELLAASAKEDFSDWWENVSQQMTNPSLEAPPGVEPVRGPSPLSVVEGEIHAAEAPRRDHGWLVALAFAAVALSTAAGVLYLVLQ